MLCVCEWVCCYVCTVSAGCVSSSSICYGSLYNTSILAQLETYRGSCLARSPATSHYSVLLYYM